MPSSFQLTGLLFIGVSNMYSFLIEFWREISVRFLAYGGRDTQV